MITPVRGDSAACGDSAAAFHLNKHITCLFFFNFANVYLFIVFFYKIIYNILIFVLYIKMSLYLKIYNIYHFFIFFYTGFSSSSMSIFIPYVLTLASLFILTLKDLLSALGS